MKEHFGRDPFGQNAVRIKRLRPDVEIPKYHTDGAAGFDLALAEDLIFQHRIAPTAPGIVLAPTGLVIATPGSHMLYITFRSSTPRKWGITVLEGIVDEDYCGEGDELMLQIMNLNQAGKRIPAGTRVAQGIFVPVTRVQFMEVESMGKSRGGWGSTG